VFARLSAGAVIQVAYENKMLLIQLLSNATLSLHRSRQLQHPSPLLTVRAFETRNWQYSGTDFLTL